MVPKKKNVDLAHLRSLVQLEEELTPLLRFETLIQSFTSSRDNIKVLPLCMLVLLSAVAEEKTT
jgi:hypothetical protein